MGIACLKGVLVFVAVLFIFNHLMSTYRKLGDFSPSTTDIS